MKQGISLIVLSITILVMAILAATVIISLEDSGIIGRSKTAVNNSNYADEYTRLVVIKNGILTDNLGTITVEEYVTELINKGIIESDYVTNADGSVTVTTKTGYEVKLSQNGSNDLNFTFESNENEKTIITFTLHSVERQAKNGMKWYEWIGSEYDDNTGMINYNNISNPTSTDIVFNGAGFYIVDSNGNDVYLLDEIVEGEVYNTGNVNIP